MPNAITNSDSLVSMGNCDDSIAEIDAMIPRLLKMKKQLAAQKEYIEVALKDANDSGNSNADSARASGSAAKIVDFRANLYKHQQKIQRLVDTSTNGSLGDDLSTSSTTVSNADKDRAKKNGGGLRADIFTASQNSGDDTQEAQTTTDIFDGVDLVGTKKFLIGVNSILTQSNDVTTNRSSPTEAIIPYSVSSSTKGDFDTSNYVAGGIHKINEEVLRGLVMRANDNEKGQSDLSEENGINIREVAGEEIIADESFAQITSRPTNMSDNSTGWLIPDQNNALDCSPAVATNLKPTLIVKNNKLLKVKVEKDNIGSGHQADDVFTVSKEHIPGTSDMTGNIYTTIGTNINNSPDGFYKITSGITSNTVSGSGMNILIQITSNVVSKIIIIAGADYLSTEVITVSQSAINNATTGNSTSDLQFTLNSAPGNYERFVYGPLTITATGASDGISQISDTDITGTGSNMSIIATIATAVITDIVIIPKGGDIRGYQTNETIAITDTALPSSTSIGDFTLTKCPSCCDSDLVLKLIKVPGATNTNATDNRGKKIRGFGL